MLDNPVWHAIDGPQSALADRVGRAGRFHPDVSMFSAVCDDAPAEAWTDLAQVIGEGGFAALFRREVVLPSGWDEQIRIPCLQMIADGVTATPSGEEPIELGHEDVPEMLELVAETQPGPFGTRTIELGTYLGYREDGKLVAMAGERFRCAGYSEISGVCTTTEARGRGLATTLVLELIRRIRARDEEAYLHVVTENVGAIRLYEALGFTVRCEPDAVVARSP